MSDAKVSISDNKEAGRASVRNKRRTSARHAQSQLSKSAEFAELQGPEQPGTFSGRMEGRLRSGTWRGLGQGTCCFPFSQARCKHGAGALGERGRALILLPVPPHLSVSGSLVSVSSKLFPTGGAQPGCHTGFTGELSPGSPLPSSLSPGQPLSCLLLQSTPWLLIFLNTSLSHCSCPVPQGSLHDLPWASPPPLVTHPELLAS